MTQRQDEMIAIVMRGLRDLLNEGVNIDDVAFDRSCNAVGLDPQVAKPTGIKLMTRSSPPMLGLTRFDLDDHPELKTNNFLLHIFTPADDRRRDPELVCECNLTVGIMGVWVSTTWRLKRTDVKVYKHMCYVCFSNLGYRGISSLSDRGLQPLRNRHISPDVGACNLFHPHESHKNALVTLAPRLFINCIFSAGRVSRIISHDIFRTS